MNKPLIHKLLKILGLPPLPNDDDYRLFQVALTHKSILKEHEEKNPNSHYDRLEFLGDSILKQVINKFIFFQYSEYNSGQLTQLSAYLLSDKTLVKIANNLNIQPYVLCKKHLKKETILGDVMEALFAAVYLTYGLDTIEKIIIHLYQDIITEANLDELKDNYKAALQEFLQSKKLGLPEYITISHTGPPHNPIFEIGVQVEGTIITTDTGSSKKQASQNAALKALKHLKESTPSPGTNSASQTSPT